MDVSIIIVNYNTCNITLNCINSIYEQTSDITFEIILVDNASHDGSKDLFSRDKRLIYIYNDKNYGFGRANNIGIRSARGRNILFLNSDTILLNNAIKYLSDYLDNTPQAGACGGNLYDKNKKPAHSFRRFYPSIWWEINSLLHNLPERFIYGQNADHNHTDKIMWNTYERAFMFDYQRYRKISVQK